MRTHHSIVRLVILMLLFFCVSEVSHAEEWKMLFGLRGKWKFELGDDMKRAEKNFNDSRWESIFAPSAWEEEGYPGYDGYAWYRKHFKSSSDWQFKTLSLFLGNIDDVDEVYINGRKIGSTGSFPPDYQTAYNADRRYEFSPNILSPDGDNVIAVRVYDDELSGGILRGDLGVYEDVQAIQADVRIPSDWKFRTGDDPEWKSPGFDDSKWDNIEVPAYWETQGYPDYDGFAWYRVRFRIPENLVNEKLILLVGKIDDFDETYLNGELVGKTGAMERRKTDIPGSDAYQRVRAYYLLPGSLTSNQENVLAIRVYDGFKDGGLYAGPIGIVTRDKYLKWQNRQKRNSNTIFDWLFK